MGNVKPGKAGERRRGWVWANSSWSELNLEILGAAGGEDDWDHRVGLCVRRKPKLQPGTVCVAVMHAKDAQASAHTELTSLLNACQPLANFRPWKLVVEYCQRSTKARRTSGGGPLSSPLAHLTSSLPEQHCPCLSKLGSGDGVSQGVLPLVF